MSTGDSKTHSFVLKIWTEEALDPSQDATWRGSVTHAETGKRQYVKTLPEVVTVVAPYLVEMGVPLDWTTRLIARWWVPHAPSDDAPTPSPSTPSSSRPSPSTSSPAADPAPDSPPSPE